MREPRAYQIVVIGGPPGLRARGDAAIQEP